MPLSPGARLGAYEIVGPLGAGGMGEVYRARDTKLGREVAVKVLPQHLVSTPEIRLDCTDERKFAIVDSVREHFRTRYDIVDVDGVRVQFGDGWGLIRASNTQPVLVVRFEALGKERLQAIARVAADGSRRSSSRRSRCHAGPAK